MYKRYGDTWAFPNEAAGNLKEEHSRRKEEKTPNRKIGVTTVMMVGSNITRHGVPRAGNRSYFGKGAENSGAPAKYGEPLFRIPGALGGLGGERRNTHRAQEVSLEGEISP